MTRPLEKSRNMAGDEQHLPAAAQRVFSCMFEPDVCAARAARCPAEAVQRKPETWLDALCRCFSNPKMDTLKLAERTGSTASWRNIVKTLTNTGRYSNRTLPYSTQPSCLILTCRVEMSVCSLVGWSTVLTAMVCTHSDKSFRRGRTATKGVAAGKKMASTLKIVFVRQPIEETLGKSMVARTCRHTRRSTQTRALGY